MGLRDLSMVLDEIVKKEGYWIIPPPVRRGFEAYLTEAVLEEREMCARIAEANGQSSVAEQIRARCARKHW